MGNRIGVYARSCHRRSRIRLSPVDWRFWLGRCSRTFKGSVDAIGAGVSYTTTRGKTPLVFNLRHYREFNSENRFEGTSTLASGTVRF